MSALVTEPTPSTPRPVVSVLDAIVGTVRPPRVSVFYVAAMVVVAAAMFALPLLYLTLIGATGYGVYYHLTHHTIMLTPGAGARFKFAAYLAPVIVGPILILFMIKPLFAPRRHVGRGLVIDSNNEPLLPEYVEKLCRALAAPVPREIRVNCDVNASASFRRGFWGALTNDLTLTIGMPLVAGLTLCELTGVLAHEFGHFTQRAAMRLSFVIRSINAWFARVVYDRDKWDEQLIAGCEAQHRGVLLFMVARLCVWLTRRILWFLMVLGHGISCLLGRQMEFNADHCEALIAGSKAFESSLRKFGALSACASFANAELSLSWRDGKLVDNFPALITSKITSIPAELKKLLEDTLNNGRTKFFHTHPCDRDRLEYIRKHPSDGIVRLDGPAQALFRNFDVLCMAATLVHYREAVDSQIGRHNLISTRQLAQATTREFEDRNAIHAYFGHDVYTGRPVFFDDPSTSPPRDGAAIAAKLKEAHRRIAAALPKIREAYKQFDDADESFVLLSAAEAMFRTGVKIKGSEFGAEGLTEETLATERRKHRALQSQVNPTLTAYEKVLQLRVNCALQLLHDNDHTVNLPDRTTLLAQARRIVAVLSRLRETLSRWQVLREDYATLVTAGRHIRVLQNNDRLVGMVHTRVGKLLTYVRETRQSVRDVEYPFDHAKGHVTLSSYLIEYVPDGKDLEASIQAVNDFCRNVADLYVRVLGRLAFIAARVEQEVGLAALPSPE